MNNLNIYGAHFNNGYFLRAIVCARGKSFFDWNKSEN